MDDLFDGCGEGCFDGLFGCLPSGRNSEQLTPGYTAGYVAGSVADTATDVDTDERRGSGTHETTHRRGHRHVKLSRVRLRLTVRPNCAVLVDEVVTHGRETLKIPKINRWLSLRWWFSWRTYWIVAFCTPDQKHELRRWFRVFKLEQPGVKR